MKKTIILFSLLFALSLQQATAQYAGAKDGIGLRYTAPNHVFPLTEKWDSENLGSGLEVEYIRHLAPALNLGLPFKIYKAFLPTDEQGNNTDQEGVMSLDLLLQLKLFREPNFIYPYLFAGFGGNLEALSDVNYSVPLGLALNFRMDRHAYLSLKGEYRIGLDDLRDNLQVGAGLLFLLGEGAEQPAKVTDTDGDGIPDNNDLCPTVAGLAAFNGCPDTDKDGIPDGEDACPQQAGTAALNGCPDRDGDGIADGKDECPDQPGPAERNGCPINDADGDGIADSVDACPNEPGPRSLGGCPDRDGDGVADKNDRCPDVKGTLVMAGCPDTDGDGLADPDDRCPETAGPASNRGCPEIKQEDREVLDFAMQNVQFETGKATLTQGSLTILNQVADILNRYPDYKLRIGGHTDSVGDAAFNQKLSESRAKSCYDYLIGKGISEPRMSFVGYGESRPIANNKYAAGREQNRRVEFDIYLD
ncbi:MAG: OmpA family protein [Phaeodactylibacter sp.]|nr:OmpA family protein [Phaeodactylibacter sp.]